MAIEYREKLKSQIRESYGRVTYTYTAQLKYMDILNTRLNWIKCSQIILSAISSGGIISTIFLNRLWLKLVSAVISTVLLCINLYFKNFDIIDQIKQHRSASDMLWDIREEYLSLLTDFENLSDHDVISKRNDLKDRVSLINKKYPKTNSKSYKRAQKALKSEEEQFFSKEELNKMLPNQLRIK
ncbi:SLATT domain-containing protein [Lactiplantibacillus plantarum]|uniref:SLATT domain-containing protein n=1 Tax=Lactiplantibacillus plantarum TaxID=1590 RepID=UPI002000F3B0|nr:SLATT domain-containing protein [Lactiplantibacillus plantarum]